MREKGIEPEPGGRYNATLRQDGQGVAKQPRKQRVLACVVTKFRAHRAQGM